MTIKARIVRIGNSRGIRLPKQLLDQSGLRDDVELVVQDGTIVVRAPRRPRAGWDEQFRAMATHGDDCPLDADVPALTRWDDSEWEW